VCDGENIWRHPNGGFHQSRPTEPDIYANWQDAEAFFMIRHHEEGRIDPKQSRQGS
jgi:hypothetical protein